MNIEINVKTVLYALLGCPLGHSLSVHMYNAAFEHMGLNKIYFLTEVKPEDLGVAIEGMKKLHFGGGNVTIPNKVEIMKYLDEISEEARLIGAVNVFKIENGKSKGSNTDGSGFFRSFEKDAGTTADGKVFFVNGAGGASRAVTVEAVLRGAQKVYICNRTVAKAEALANDINTKIRPCAIPLPREREKIAAAMEDTDVVINTTSIGMYPRVDDLSLDVSLLNPNIIVCDVIYNPERTKLIQEVEKLGCKTVTGVNMFICQGVESFKIWTDMDPPIDIMGNVVRAALAK